MQSRTSVLETDFQAQKQADVFNLASYWEHLYFLQDLKLKLKVDKLMKTEHFVQFAILSHNTIHGEEA